MNIEELSIAIAMVEYYQTIIDNAKEELRNLTNEELETINKSNKLIIKRQNYTKTIYSNEYKQAVEEIAKKYPPAKETIENHTIKLQATTYTKEKAKLLTQKLATLNKTQLKAVTKNVTKNATKKVASKRGL